MRAILFLKEYDNEKKVWRYHYVVEGTSVRFAVEFKEEPSKEEVEKKVKKVLKDIKKTLQEEEYKGEVVEL